MRLASLIMLAYLAWTVGAHWPDTLVVMGDAFTDGPVDRCDGARDGMATVFGFHGDRHAGGDALGLGRPVNPDLDTGDVSIAHRSWPMGERVEVCYRGLCSEATVIDREPYGCDLHGNGQHQTSDVMGHEPTDRDGVSALAPVTEEPIGGVWT